MASTGHCPHCLSARYHSTVDQVMKYMSIYLTVIYGLILGNPFDSRKSICSSLDII